MNQNLYLVPSPLPAIPRKADKSTIRTLFIEYATKNNFTLTTHRSEKNRLVLICKKGESYRNTRGTDPIDKQRIRLSCKIDCPYKLTFYQKKNEGFELVQSKDENAYKHNHLFDEANLLSSAEGRKNNLNS